MNTAIAARKGRVIAYCRATIGRRIAVRVGARDVLIYVCAVDGVKTLILDVPVDAMVTSIVNLSSQAAGPGGGARAKDRPREKARAAPGAGFLADYTPGSIIDLVV